MAESRQNVSPRVREKNWTDQEVRVLIDAYRHVYDGSDGRHVKSHLNWKRITEHMAPNGVVKDHNKARHKFNNLKQQYRKTKAAMNGTGNGAEDVETFEYFDLMDSALGSLDSSTLRYVGSSPRLRREDEPTESQQSSEAPAQPGVSGRLQVMLGLQHLQGSNRRRLRTLMPCLEPSLSPTLRQLRRSSIQSVGVLEIAASTSPYAMLMHFAPNSFERPRGRDTDSRNRNAYSNASPKFEYSKVSG